MILFATKKEEENMSFPYQQCKQPCLPPPVCGKGSSTQCKVCVPACPSPSVPVCVSPGVKVIGEPCIPVCPPPCVPKCTGPAVDSICVKPQGVCPCDCKCPDPCCKCLCISRFNGCVFSLKLCKLLGFVVVIGRDVFVQKKQKLCKQKESSKNKRPRTWVCIK
ncbi:hypothetical protein Chor_005023 [Crotalus horridus]